MQSNAVGLKGAQPHTKELSSWGPVLFGCIPLVKPEEISSSVQNSKYSDRVFRIGCILIFKKFVILILILPLEFFGLKKKV